MAAPEIYIGTAVLSGIGGACGREIVAWVRGRRNGNSKYDAKECNRKHGKIDLRLQRIEDVEENHEARLGKGDERFDKIMDRLSSIDSNIAVIADRATRRRQGDYSK